MTNVQWLTPLCTHGCIPLRECAGQQCVRDVVCLHLLRSRAYVGNLEKLFAMSGCVTSSGLDGIRRDLAGRDVRGFLSWPINSALYRMTWRGRMIGVFRWFQVLLVGSHYSRLSSSFSLLFTFHFFSSVCLYFSLSTSHSIFLHPPNRSLSSTKTPGMELHNVQCFRAEVSVVLAVCSTEQTMPSRNSI